MSQFDVNDHTQAIADYLPNDRLFEAKNINDSNLRKVLKGLAGEFYRCGGYLDTLEQEYYPDATSLFVSEWEQALGIPDCCFTGDGSIEDRQRDVFIKFAGMWVQTADDFEAMALLFGKTVEVTSLSEEALPPYDVPFNPTSFPEARYTIVVTGDNIVTNVPPYDVPFDLFSNNDVMQCVFKRQAPENCNVIFRNN